MCLSTGEAFLGPADAALDVTGRRLLFATGLTDDERVLLARRVLHAAGQEQPSGSSPDVVCICGFGLDVSLAGQAPPAFLSAVRRGGTVRLTLAGRAVAVDMDPAARYREGDEADAWAAIRNLVTGDSGDREAV